VEYEPRSWRSARSDNGCVEQESSFATVVRFFNVIGYAFRTTKELTTRTNHIKEFYNSCKAAFSAKCSY